MLTLEYCKYGRYCSDFDIEDLFKEILNKYKKEQDLSIKISSELLLLRFRVAIKQGEIDYNNICLKYNNMLIYFHKDGGMDRCPDSYFDLYLDKLIDWKNNAN